MALRLERKYDQRFSNSSPSRSTSRRSLALGVPSFILDTQKDDRVMFWAVGAAALFHAVLFMVTFPSFRNTEPRTLKSPQKAYVIQQVRFKQPEPVKANPLPKKRVKKIPIPDPTPDLPEPIRTYDYEAPEIEVPEIGDFEIAGLPDAPPGAGVPGAMSMGGEVDPPEKLFAPQPGYTEEARQARVQGVVILQAVIDVLGQVTNIKVLKGLPQGLADAAVMTVATWRFKPATLKGTPVPVYYNFTVNFSLQ